jgi:hypothetical protein
LDLEQSMHEDAPRGDEGDDVSGLNRVERAAFDADDVAGPDGRTHARARDTEADAAEPAKRISQQIGAGLGDHVGVTRCHRDQEFFLTALHGPLVALILPQANAMVSKTCSRTNAGFS